MITHFYSSDAVVRYCSLCILIFAVGCEPEVRVVGNLSSNDLAAIKATVHGHLIQRWGLASRPIKSIATTTNNSYENDKRWLLVVDAWAKTNASFEAPLRKLRERFDTRLATEATNLAVKVWYADTNARWGEAGFILERQTAGWKIVSELFR